MPSELLPNSTFSVMNKVMNNFKKQSKTRLIELVNENVIPQTLKQNLKSPVFAGLFFYLNISNSFPLNFFETSKQAELFSIFPSEIILKLFSFSVEPVEVISVINSAEPVKG